MKIAVLVKQVPATADIEVDSETGIIKRDSAKGKLNPFDLFAIETALSVCEDFGGEVTALSMGPASAAESLLESLHMGVEKAFLLSDPALAGSDVLATSAAIAGMIKALGGFDLIVCGKQTTDGDTAQV